MPDPEASEADVLEQELPIPGQPEVLKPEPAQIPVDVPEADALEQQHPVDLDEDEAPR